MCSLFLLSMTEPHTIRLNGPWEMIAGVPDEPTRVKLPAAWPQIIQAARSSSIVLQRWFHRPTGIDDGSVVQLKLAELPFSGSISLNDTSLGMFPAQKEHALDVGDHLTDRCCLTISVGEVAELSETIPTPQISLAILPPQSH